MKKQTIAQILKTQKKETLDCEDALKEIEKNNRAIKSGIKVQLSKHRKNNIEYNSCDELIIEKYNFIEVVKSLKNKGFKYKLVAEIFCLKETQLRKLISKSILQDKITKK